MRLTRHPRFAVTLRVALVPAFGLACSEPAATRKSDPHVDTAPDTGECESSAYYADADGDGFGAGEATLACESPAGTVMNHDDCDDATETVFPGADEHCDGADEDCDGDVDEDAVGAPTWFPDDDRDGYGGPDAPVVACEAPRGYFADSGDCDDADASVHPGAPDPEDGVDSDCNGWEGCSTLYAFEGDINFAGRDTEDVPDLCVQYNSVHGNVVLDFLSGEDLAALSCLCAVDGDLTISDTYVSKLSGLSQLTTVTGALRIDADGLGSFVGLEGVQRVGSLFVASGTAADLSGLDGLETVDGDAEIACGGITHPTGIGALQSVGGDLLIRGATLVDLDGFDALDHVGGDLTIKTYAATSFTGLETLSDVDGNVTVTVSYHITDMTGLSGLTSIGGDLDLRGNPALTSTSGLDSLAFIGGDLLVCERGTSLVSVGGLDALREIGGSFNVESNCSLTSLSGLSGLERIGGDFSVVFVEGDNNPLRSLAGLGPVQSIGGSLSLTNGSSYDGLDDSDLSPFSALSGIGGNLYIKYIDVTTLHGLDALTDVGGNVTLSEVYWIDDLTGLDALNHVGGDLGVGNAYLTSTAGLGSLSAVDGDLTLAFLDGLTDIDTLTTLSAVGGNLTVRYNDALPNIDGLSGVTSIGGRLFIERNESLLTVSGLRGTENIAGDFIIEDNTALPTSDAEALRDAIGIANIGGTVTISGNAP